MLQHVSVDAFGEWFVVIVDRQTMSCDVVDTRIVAQVEAEPELEDSVTLQPTETPVLPVVEEPDVIEEPAAIEEPDVIEGSEAVEGAGEPGGAEEPEEELVVSKWPDPVG